MAGRSDYLTPTYRAPVCVPIGHGDEVGHRWREVGQLDADLPPVGGGRHARDAGRAAPGGRRCPAPSRGPGTRGDRSDRPRRSAAPT
ncbi:hypothetical protein HMPREF9057_00778 [Actinomyces sp. oral taxon 171 str. F0337]|nr:hypothetical protein HMPREF9057_00778 [Actinomyces sp. oral taxon 171 str. F0337]